jgi:hypothetical protein
MGLIPFQTYRFSVSLFSAWCITGTEKTFLVSHDDRNDLFLVSIVRNHYKVKNGPFQVISS